MIHVDFLTKTRKHGHADHPFAMFVDEACLDPEAFDRALLSYGRKETDLEDAPETGED